MWVVRINAAARTLDINYSLLIRGLKLAEVEIDRKVLAFLAVEDMPAFTEIVAKAKAALSADTDK